MKQFLLVLACFLSMASSIDLNAQKKIKLTDKQIIGELPAGIINNRPKNELAANKRVNVPSLVEKWVNPTYSPDSSKIAYTLNNDLYSIDVKSKEIIRHTFNGSDVILNGYASWVYYEEIFGRLSNYKAFWWSPDSHVLAFYSFDNSKVPMFPIYNSEGQYGSINETRYPKAGEVNPSVKIGFVSVKGGETVWADFDSNLDQYFGTPFWNAKGDRLMVSWMDRSQDNLSLYEVDPIYGTVHSCYTEHQEAWIDWMDQMLFSQEGIYIIRDFDHWQQIYFLSYDGTQFDRVSDGGQNWNVKLLKLDKKYLYFTAKRESFVRNDIYRITLRNKKTERVSFGDYNFTNVTISNDNTQVFATMSNSQTPNRDIVINIPRSGNLSKTTVETLFDSKGSSFDNYALAMPEIVYITTRNGSKLPASVIWPIDMDKSGRTKYPVKVDIYGGPDTPQVLDSWKGISFKNQWWANHGVIQLVLDTRSAGYLGKAGMEEVYRQLGVLELDDLIDGIEYFTKLTYVNAQKVGVEGFSYGGTMSVLCATQANEYFQYAIAGGSVTDWALYDSHYTERYMDTPQDNPVGYKKSAVLGRVSAYKGDKSNMLRITHGTGDDNVHFQNTLQLIDTLQSQNKDFELMIYPQGMHGYRGAQARQSDFQDYRFWYEYLLEEDLPEILKQR